MSASPLNERVEKTTFWPIPNQELTEFILYRLNIADEQHTMAVRTLHCCERQLYKRLAEQGTSIPPMKPRAKKLEDRHNDALSIEIFKRSGFDLKGFPMNNKGPEDFKRELWELLRRSGFVYCIAHSANGRWSLGSDNMMIYCDVKP